MDNEYDNIASTSSIPIPKHSGDDEIMELLWQNIAPVAANPSSNSMNSSSISGVTVPPSPPPLNLSALASNNQFYMAEDQMASWLHNPNSLVLPSLMVAASCPMGSMVATSSTPMPISTVRESLETEEVGQEESNTSTSSCSANNNLATIAATATNDAEKCVTTAICEMVDRKKKSREVEESLATPTATTRAINTHTKEVAVQPKSGDEKKQVQGSCSSKRTRTAEEHNLSERRRRSRINENLKALQEIIPGCNKTDKASMLEEAIEYLKSLKMQAQTLSMGYGMLFQGIQQPYMPPPMGMGMYMGLGMDLGMTRPLVPYAPMMPPPPSLPSPPATNIVSPLAPRTTVTPYVVPLALSAQHSVDQPSILANSSGSSYAVPTPEMTPTMANSCQQYLTYMQMQMQMQMQAAQMFSQPGSSKPDAIKSVGDNGDNDDTK